MWHWCKNERWYFIVMHHDYLLAPIFLFCLARCCFRCGYRGASSSSSSLTTATTHQPSGALLAAGACGDHHGRGARAGWLVWSAHTSQHHTTKQGATTTQPAEGAPPVLRSVRAAVSRSTWCGFASQSHTIAIVTVQ